MIQSEEWWSLFCLLGQFRNPNNLIESTFLYRSSHIGKSKRPLWNHAPRVKRLSHICDIYTPRINVKNLLSSICEGQAYKMTANWEAGPLVLSYAKHT